MLTIASMAFLCRPKGSVRASGRLRVTVPVHILTLSRRRAAKDIEAAASVSCQRPVLSNLLSDGGPAEAALDGVIGCAKCQLGAVADVPHNDLLRILVDPPAAPAPAAKRGKGAERANDPEAHSHAAR